MKRNFLHKILYLSSAVLALAAGACTDEIYCDNGNIPQGHGDMCVDMSFEAVDQANLGRSEGNSMDAVTDLWVVLYNTDGTLFRALKKSQLLDYSQSNSNTGTSPDGVGPGEHQAQSPTVRATFTIPNIPFGRYCIYAVANADLSGQDISTAALLRHIKFTWQPGNMASNAQMFGYFTETGAQSSKGFEAPVLTFTRSSQTVHAWLKRLASKITVSFDDSGLYDDVNVYIHTVTVRDMPKECRLGMDNTPTSAAQLLNRPDATPVANSRLIYNNKGNIGDLKAPGDTDSDDYLQWLWLANGRGTKGSDHGANSEALFFYENMQGDYEGQTQYDKRQQRPGNPDAVGDVIDTPTYNPDGSIANDYKDRVEWGTYVEVEGFYVSINPQNPSEGPIKYRFMLGKNTTFNYNAERNYHYKLTLGFKGWANQPDWHIEYIEPDPSIEVGPTFNLSYLYNQKAMLPIKLNGNCTKLTLEIKENNWAPWDENAGAVPPGNVPSTPTDYHFAWAKTQVYDKGFNGTQRPYLGFLALQVPGNSEADIPADILTSYNYSDCETAMTALENYYTSNGQNKRVLSGTDLSVYGMHKAANRNNDWEVSKLPEDVGTNGLNQRIVRVPLWTRNKTMVQGTCFSGNNQFEYYSRRALVKLTGEFLKDGVPLTRTAWCTVYQVPRVINPKGVWRPYNDNRTFNVQLKNTLNSNSHSNFTTMESKGTWRAYIEAPKGVSFIKLAASAGTVGTVRNDTVYGRTGSLIDFDILFNGVGQTEAKCAVVRVDYHGYNCIHKIFVRQGYGADIKLGGKTWSTFSVYCNRWTSGGTDGVNDTYTTVFTKNPLAMGSFFRRGRQSQAILASNESRSGFGPMQAPNGGVFNIRRYSGGWVQIQQTWDAIGFNTTINQPASDHGRFNNGSKAYKCPTLADFKALQTKCDFGFGIVYGKGATATADDFTTATGLVDNDNTGNDTPRGMRSVVVYDAKTADQVLFPLGATGMGRRRRYNLPSSPAYDGTLWYTDVNALIKMNASADHASTDYKNAFRPLAYNLYISAGAIYWIDAWVAQGYQNSNGTWQSSMGWDINFRNCDFAPYTANNYRDACPMKLVLK